MSKLGDDIIHSNAYIGFLHTEITKRHIEEYEPELLDDITIIKDGLSTYWDDSSYDDDNMFAVAVGEALTWYHQYINGFDYQINDLLRDIYNAHPVLFDFDNKGIRNAYNKLIQFSYKYNILATEILYPTSMEDVIRSSFDISRISGRGKFNYSINDKFSIIGVQDNIFVLKNDNRLINEDDIDYLKFQFINYRLNKNSYVPTYDKKFYTSYMKENECDLFKKDAFADNIFGLYIWDCYKKDKKNMIADLDSNLYYLYKKYKIRKCKETNMSCKTCSSQHDCSRRLRDVRLIASNAIKERKIIESKTRKNYIKPKNNILLERKKLDWFNGITK